MNSAHCKVRGAEHKVRIFTTMQQATDLWCFFLKLQAAPASRPCHATNERSHKMAGCTPNTVCSGAQMFLLTLYYCETLVKPTATHPGLPRCHDRCVSSFEVDLELVAADADDSGRQRDARQRERGAMSSIALRVE